MTEEPPSDPDENLGASEAMEDRPAIRELDHRTIERIAAGEVVERPASVVKELVENSLDADSSRLRIVVENGGKDGIRVTDDGMGMSEEGVRRAVEEHTTSKITDIADIEAGVASLGFRGEALSSIGAVSRATIRTKPRGGARGTELRIEGGEVTAVESAGCPEGTTIAVEDLFYNVPARRKYLKQTGTEFSHVNRVVTGYALANPDVAVALEHNDRELFSTTGRGDLEGTVLSVYGREVAEAMVPVEPHRNSLDGLPEGSTGGLPEGPLEDVSGLISHPETTRSTAEHCSTYVNGRYVRAKVVRDAVLEAYGGQLAPDRYPFAVLFLSLPADTVDVNVHPRKQEVRFADEAGVREQVETVVEAALVEHGLVRSGAPRGRSAPDQATISPEESATDSTDSLGAEPDQLSEDSRPTVDDADDTTGGHANEPAGETTTRRSESSVDATERRGTGADAEGTPEESFSWGTTESPEAATGSAEQSVGDRLSGRHDVENPTERGADPAENRGDATRKFTGGDEQATLDGECVATTPEFDRLPPLRVLGQVHDTYLVCESPDGIVLLDQHAADERVNYERLHERISDETPTQALAEPLELELTPGEAAVFGEREDALREVGFRASLVGPEDRTARLTGVPAVLGASADPELLRDALSGFVAEGHGGTDRTVDGARDALLADLACYPSITANTSLAEGSVLDLLAALDSCGNPYACPHGRPVLIEVSHTELEDRFERDYPGHAGRRTE